MTETKTKIKKLPAKNTGTVIRMCFVS